MTSFRNSIKKIVPPWLLNEVNEKILFTVALGIDTVSQWAREGVRARWPDIAPEDALGHIGNDRGIDRGPAEPSTSYRPRLRRAVDTWRNAGGARTITTEVANYFIGLAQPGVRLVSDASVWHEWDWGTKTVTKTRVTPANWVWDAFTGARWWRGWAILDVTGIWAEDVWDDTDASLWGDGGVWGSDAEYYQLQAIRNIIRKWKPANVYVRSVILTFTPALFRRTDSNAANVDSRGEDEAWRSGLDANFLESVET